ncbi:MAG: succinylglutamate desuccinylase/aspartoacylase family protein [Chitinophagales bacterium]|nr:succinylglutamate desuccinylase/aspartoacylase family protein [Chitinophagales bacterium]
MVHNRITGQYQGREAGPLVIVTSAMHGNEGAGVRAMEMFFKMLEMEHHQHLDFKLKGSIFGLVGNMQAYQQGKRYIREDINRMWNQDHIATILSSDPSTLEDEDKEIYEIIREINHHIEQIQPSKIYFLDLHTTSSDGIFTIEGGTEESRAIGLKIQAPMVSGLLDGLSGTTLHYFDKVYQGIPSVTMAFEGGHHDDALSINRCMAAVMQFLRAVGLIGARDLIGTYDYILNFYNKEMPVNVQVEYRHHVDDANQWKMELGFKNFDTIYQGQLLATYENEEIYAPMSGYILMPLYQNLGHDGFFICTEKA